MIDMERMVWEDRQETLEVTEVMDIISHDLEDITCLMTMPLTLDSTLFSKTQRKSSESSLAQILLPTSLADLRFIILMLIIIFIIPLVVRLTEDITHLLVDIIPLIEVIIPVLQPQFKGDMRIPSSLPSVPFLPLVSEDLVVLLTCSMMVMLRLPLLAALEEQDLE